MIINWFNRKNLQISENTFSHRTSIGRFITNSSWNEIFVTNLM